MEHPSKFLIPEMSLWWRTYLKLLSLIVGAESEGLFEALFLFCGMQQNMHRLYSAFECLTNEFAPWNVANFAHLLCGLFRQLNMWCIVIRITHFHPMFLSSWSVWSALVGIVLDLPFSPNVMSNLMKFPLHTALYCLGSVLLVIT